MKLWNWEAGMGRFHCIPFVPFEICTNQNKQKKLILFFKLSSEETTVRLNIGESHKHNKQKKLDTPKEKKI